MVGVTVLISGLLLSPLQGQHNIAQTALGAMFLFANVAIAETTGGYFDAAADSNPLLHTWSLSVEEQFYLIFPLLLVFAWAASRRFQKLRSAPAPAVAAVGAGSFALAIVTSRGYHVPYVPDLGFYSPFTRAWEFAAGALLALVGVRHGRSSPWLSGALGLAGLAMLATSLWFITEATPFPGSSTLLPVVGSLLIIQAGLQSSNPISRVLGSRPFVFIGDLSYSWYLWHWPLIVFTAVLWPENATAAFLAAALSLVPAGASYRWVEQPIRNLRDVGRRGMAAIVCVTLLAPVSFAALLLVAVNNGFWSPDVKTLQAEVSPLHAAAVAGCTTGTVQGQRAPGKCQWNAAATGRPLYLIGDSNADQFSEALVGAGRRLDRPVTISTFNGCALIGVSWSDQTEAKQRECRAYVDGTVQWFQNAPDGLVVIGISDSLWVAPNVAVGPTREAETSERQSKVRYLDAQLASLVRALQQTGQDVLIMQPIPKPWKVEGGKVRALYEPERCSTLSVLGGDCPRVVELSRTYEDRLQADPRGTIRRVAADTGARVLDLRDYFCPHGTCSTHEGKTPLYRDGGHITVRTSRELALTLAEAIRGMSGRRQRPTIGARLFRLEVRRALQKRCSTRC